jgi:glutamate--cysteine ligase
MSSKQSGSHEILVKDRIIDEAVELLIGNYADGKAKKIGLEVEMPFVNNIDLKPIDFEGMKSITAIFNMLSGGKKDWLPGEIENGKVTSLKNATGSITLEPGGQIEFSSAARSTLQQLEKDVDAYFKDMKKVSSQIGIDVVPYGFHPHLTIYQCPYIDERSRFKALKSVFEAEGGFSAWGQSCSVQVTLDSPSKEKAFDAFKLGLLLQPIAAAVFANSPFSLGQDSGHQSWRRQKLQALDSPLYKVPEELFEPGYTLKDWAAHTLSVPMSFIVRNDAYIAVAPKPFYEMIGKPLPELAHLPESEQYLTKNDLLDHMTGIKPEMLLKPNLLLECRAADLGPTKNHWMAVGAFWTGILYDEQAFKAAQDYVADWTKEERIAIRDGVAKNGLATTAGNKNVQQIAIDLIEISKQGLSRIEPDAVKYLNVIEEQVAKGLTSATKAVQKFEQNDGDIHTTLKQTFLFHPETTQYTVNNEKPALQIKHKGKNKPNKQDKPGFNS